MECIFQTDPAYPAANEEEFSQASFWNQRRKTAMLQLISTIVKFSASTRHGVELIEWILPFKIMLQTLI